MSLGGDSFSSQSESNCDWGWRPLYTSMLLPSDTLCFPLPSSENAGSSGGCGRSGGGVGGRPGGWQAGGRRGAPARGVPRQSSARTVSGCTSRPDGTNPHTYLRVAIKIEPELTASIGETVKKCFRNDRLINNRILSDNRCFESSLR